VTTERLRWARLAVVALGVAAACDTPTVPAPDAPDCTAAPVVGDAYCPTTLVPFIYHWSVGHDIAIYVDTTHAPADADLITAVQQGITMWENVSVLGDVHLHTVSNPHDADVIMHHNTSPILAEPDDCEYFDFGAGGNTFFCVLDPATGQAEVFNFADGSAGHVKMYVTMNRVKFNSAAQFSAAVAHELGHVLGIGAHSGNQSDLMFGVPQVPLPSASDIMTLRYVLSLKPDVRF
jgi:predicted Zn-dependent protease